MSGRGGRRPGAGRPKGRRNKATADVMAAAQEYTEETLQILVAIARDPEAPAAARVAASNSILDRGHGKPAQALEVGGKDGGPIEFVMNVGKT